MRKLHKFLVQRRIKGEGHHSQGLNFLICNVGKLPLFLSQGTVVREKEGPVCERWADQGSEAVRQDLAICLLNGVKE